MHGKGKCQWVSYPFYTALMLRKGPRRFQTGWLKGPQNRVLANDRRKQWEGKSWEGEIQKERVLNSEYKLYPYLKPTLELQIHSTHSKQPSKAKRTVIGWVITPYPLEPVHVTSYGKVFAEVIRDLNMGRRSWIIQLGPKYTHMHSYTRETEGDFSIHRAEGDVKTEPREIGEWWPWKLK